MTHYLIEFRFSGHAKLYLKDLIYDVAEKFRVRGAIRKRAVPHITLVGPFYTKNQKQLVREFKHVVSKYDLVPFQLKGFGHFGRGFFNWLIGKKKVVFVELTTSDLLNQMRLELVDKLKPFCQLNEYDYMQNRHFHATLAFKDIDAKFADIWKYLQSKEEPNLDQHMLRVTLIKDQKILYEYDFMQHRLLNRMQAKNKALFRKTLQIFRERQGKLPEGKREIIDEQPVGRVFFISDLHFDHANIIRYCKRPFKSKTEMNQALVKNWNDTVKENDTVYILGDIAFGRSHRSIDYWLRKLNGRLLFIRGNHDKGRVTQAEEIPNNTILTYKGREFMLMHDPERPENWKDWIIHGDAHNNDLNNHPFINFEKIKPAIKTTIDNKTGQTIKKNIIAGKTINVSAEVVGYRPILLDHLIKYAEMEKSLRTIEDV